MREARILFKDRDAGTLMETAGGGTRFVYAADWSQDIACCLPVASKEHEWQQGLHPFFQHLGAEGWLREHQARAAHIGVEDDLGMLLRYGADCIGAVSILPSDRAEPAIVMTKATVSPGRTVSGVHKKLLVSRAGRNAPFQPAAADGPAGYIAKFNSDSIPSLVRNEALSLGWATAVLGESEVNRFERAFIPDLGEQALVVTRFDRTAQGDKLQMEDCAQILCKPKGQDYGGKYEAAYEDIAAIITQHSARPVIDLARFFRRLIVYALVGNCDAHLKNFSLLETPEGLRLSPAYDILNIVLIGILHPEYGFDQNMALSISGQKRLLSDVDGALLRAFGLEIGLQQRAVDQIFKDLERKVKKAEGTIQPPSGETPDGFITRYQEIVRNACLRIFTQ